MLYVHVGYVYYEINIITNQSKKKLYTDPLAIITRFSHCAARYRLSFTSSLSPEFKAMMYVS